MRNVQPTARLKAASFNVEKASIQNYIMLRPADIVLLFVWFCLEWEKVSSKFLPLAVKFTYNWNMRELNNIFLGMCQVPEQG